MTKQELHSLCLTEKNRVDKRRILKVLTQNNLVNSVQSILPEKSLEEAYFWYYYDLKSYPKTCVTCGKELTKFVNFAVGYGVTTDCSLKCARLNKSNQSKTKNTIFEKYGVTHQMYIPAVVELVKKTVKERYGRTPLHSEKAKNTRIQKYGNAQISKTDYWRQKTKDTFYNKYGGYGFQKNNVLNEESCLTLSEELNCSRDISLQKMMSFKRDRDKMLVVASQSECEIVLYDFNLETVQYRHKCGAIQSSSLSNPSSRFRCYTCFPKSQSLFEISFFKFLSECTSEEILKNDRSLIKPLELDFYIPSLKIAFECNGDFWHSYNKKESHTEKMKHHNKASLCESIGVRLIQLSDTQWENKREFVEDLVKSSLGLSKKVFARNTEIRKVFRKEAEVFLNKNHIQGFASSKFYFGLYLNDELLSVIGLGKKRFSKSNSAEIIRSSTKLGYTIVGGFSKLLSAAKVELSNQGFESLMSYVDRSIFSGNSLLSVGFSKTGITKPGYKYIKDEIQLSRFEAQHSKLPFLLKDKYRADLSEQENMFASGYRRLWDAGNLIFSINIK
jgi:hypothetical protein